MPPVIQPFDRQQNKLYTAQWNAFMGTPLDTALSTSECIGFHRILFNRATEMGFWKGGYIPPIKIVADLGGMAGRATWQLKTVYDARIDLAPNGKVGWIIAHEAAHILLMAGRLNHAHMEGHGKEYAAVFIWCVSALFGKKWSNRLKRAFAEARIEAICTFVED